MTLARALAALAKATDVYYERGWHLIPVVIDPSAGGKRPALPGTTGADGRYLDADEVKASLVHHRGTWPGIGIRATPGVVGIDVDAYGAKVGARVLRDLAADLPNLGHEGLGPLPPTWRSSARPGDSVSGIRWYRYDPLKGDPSRDVGDDVETIRWGHRFGVASPTYHPTGMPYRWYDPQGRTCAPPRITDLAWLPDTWLAHVSSQPYASLHRDVGSSVPELVAAGGWVRELALGSLATATAEMESAPEGSRNKTLFRLAKDLAAAGLDLTDLRTAAVRSGLSPREVAATIRSATAP